MNTENNNLIPIGKASEMLGVSIDTLRRWDKKGLFRAVKSPNGHRYYSLVQIEAYRQDLFSLAKDWVLAEKESPLPEEFHCQNSGIFQGQLQRMEKNLMETEPTRNWMPLIVSATGEIGNNSFDHNLGNWRDIPGVLFAYDVKKRQVMLADRGQGVLTTLRRVRPALSTDEEALHTAFTEVVSGRAPEARGNGLKLVKLIVERYPVSVDFYSGTAQVTLRHGEPMNIKASGVTVLGCLAKISY